MTSLPLQREKHDCGVAALAAITGEPYEKVYRILCTQGWRPTTGTRTRQLHLASISLRRRLKAPRLNRRARWDEIPNHSLLKMPIDGQRNWHWVVKIDGELWDPSWGGGPGTPGEVRFSFVETEPND